MTDPVSSPKAAAEWELGFLRARIRIWHDGLLGRPGPDLEQMRADMRYMLDRPAAETPAGECQHDLLRPDTTIEVIDAWKARCKTCFNFFDLPGRPAADVPDVCPRCQGSGTNHSPAYLHGSATCLLCKGTGRVQIQGKEVYECSR